MLCRNGKKVAAILSFEDLEFLEGLEDDMDIRASNEALKGGKFLTLEDVKKRLGIK